MMANLYVPFNLEGTAARFVQFPMHLLVIFGAIVYRKTSRAAQECLDTANSTMFSFHFMKTDVWRIKMGSEFL